MSVYTAVSRPNCLHDILGILWLVPVLQVVQVAYKGLIIHVSGLHEVCRGSTPVRALVMPSNMTNEHATS